jgi:hypothetical protein
MTGRHAHGFLPLPEENHNKPWTFNGSTADYILEPGLALYQNKISVISFNKTTFDNVQAMLFSRPNKLIPFSNAGLLHEADAGRPPCAAPNKTGASSFDIEFVAQQQWVCKE